MNEVSEYPSEDLFWRHLKSLPAFRALLRSVEARFYETIDLPEPVLDLGCGDGNFASLTFDHSLSVGFDPWWNPLRKASSLGAYEFVIQGLGHQLPFPSNYFGSVISNSVLEHISGIDPVLHDVARVLKPGGKLVVTMPTDNFTNNLGGSAILESIGLTRLANYYRRFFNRISRHAHTDSPETWADRFDEVGLEVEESREYFSTDALRALEIGHAYGLPSALIHFLTGQWIIAPWESNLRLTETWLRKYYEEDIPSEGTYVFFIVRKKEIAPHNGLEPSSQTLS